ncbi:MAG: glutamine amidotransferase [Ruminococcaceae bacterium]|nr:glutamine amidotransferase [Oscillospiraceae bacterium]
MNYHITIGHLYPDLLNLYGDKGNIAALQKRLEWRNISVEIKEFCVNDTIDFSALDLVFLGGGSDREQQIVCNKLSEQKAELKEYIESDGVLMAVCGGYQILGKYYQVQNETVDGLGLLDFYTENKSERLMGKVVIQSGLFDDYIVGFENHGSRTYTNHLPLGMVKHGNGNNGEDHMEGVIYKNTIGTYLHGPLLPANPKLTDWLLTKSLERKYGQDAPKLTPLDDTDEDAARNYIVKNYLK